MSVKHEDLEVISGIQRARPGDPALRVSFIGDPSSVRYEVEALFGSIASTEPEFVEEHEAYALPMQAVAKGSIEHQYMDFTDTMAVIMQAHQNLKYAYNKPMLFSGLASGMKSMISSVKQLCDNRWLDDHHQQWQASAVGVEDVRLLRRALFKSIGSPERTDLETPRTMLTDPQLRADMVNFMAGYAINAFYDMPLTDPEKSLE